MFPPDTNERPPANVFSPLNVISPAGTVSFPIVRTSPKEFAAVSEIEFPLPFAIKAFSVTIIGRLSSPLAPLVNSSCLYLFPLPPQLRPLPKTS